MKERSIYSLSIKVNKTGPIQEFDVDLQNIDSHVKTEYDPSSLARVLDMVFPADQKAGLNTGSPASRNDPEDNVEVRGLTLGACYSTNIYTLCSLLFAALWPVQCFFAVRLQVEPTDPDASMPPHLMSLLNLFVNSVRKRAICFIVYLIRHTTLPI